MSEIRPSYLVQGEQARLFPVLSTVSKEGRTTSIVLSCMARVHEFGASILGEIGVKIGVRARLDAYTEVVFERQNENIKDRPDGLVVVATGKREWRALVEAKVGNNGLDASQIERYRSLAKENGIDCVITISNQFATSPSSHPIEDVRKSRSKVPVYHFSWMTILTKADLLVSKSAVEDRDQLLLLNELRRFLSHESAGVKGFDRMPREWTELNRHVTSGGTIPLKSQEAEATLSAWHQETKDLALILSRLTETPVSEKLPRKHAGDPSARLKDEAKQLKECQELRVSFSVPDAAAPLEVKANLARRSIDVSMALRAPEDKKSTKARLNWLLRQIKVEDETDIYIRLLWPGNSEPTQHPLSVLRENPDCCDEDKKHLVAHRFEAVLSRQLGARFAQQVNFISELETIVPDFYGRVGSNLSAWRKSAPKIRDKKSSEDVSTEAIHDDAEDFDA
ncbi:hypothetical protein [Dinoroseobacter sp. S124A]|uniref:hypothetical protein n=1 Tax=Dinoroseobacter sp. S124A TaxID=3415128 RepID=UPI003C7D95A6